MNKFDIYTHALKVILSCKTEAHLKVAGKVYYRAIRLLRTCEDGTISTTSGRLANMLLRKYNEHAGHILTTNNPGD